MSADREEVLVVEILAGDGPITKVSDGTKTGSRYRYNIIYRLEDGRLIPSTSTAKRMKDAKAKVEAFPEVPTTYELRVQLNDEDEVYCTSYRFQTIDFLEAMERARVASENT